MSSRSYIAVRWRHNNSEEPIMFLSELDEDRNEVRKIEVWSDGRTGFADEHQEVGGTRLGLEPVPANDEIAADPQFEVTEISEWDFAQEWRKRRWGAE